MCPHIMYAENKSNILGSIYKVLLEFQPSHKIMTMKQ